MPFQQNNPINMATVRSYDIFIPPTPRSALLPAIIVFHGHGQDISTIEAHWGIDPANPGVPPLVAEYMLVFAETDPTLMDEWVHYKKGDGKFPEHDLLYVDTLVNELTNTAYNTGDPNIPTVSADPNLLYVAGFSNGAGMVWQIANSSRVGLFQGFATVGKGLDPEKAMLYRDRLQQQQPPTEPAPIPLIYIMGTADPAFRSPMTLAEVPIDSTYPFYSVEDMLRRNFPMNPPGQAQTQLIAGSANVTEVVAQLWAGGSEAFSYVTVINGGHNWPTPTTRGNPPVATHFNATEAIVEFWKNFAGLP
jgi:poly(3-hydroxybutyrate) depolymerase